MPAMYTHYRFGKNVLEETNIKDEINYDIYKVFNQSFDSLYYNIIPPTKKNILISKIGYKAHNKNTNLYFKNILTYIKENNLNKNKDILAYLYGSINHYTLDSTIHPYIYYKTGRYYKNQKDTHKYNGKHSNMEYSIDAFLYKHDHNLDYKNFTLFKEVFPKINLSDELSNTINYVFKNTFDIYNYDKHYLKAINKYRKLFKLFSIDRYTIKTILWKIIYYISFKNMKDQSTSTTYKKNIDLNILNLEKNNWYHPVTNEEFNSSFFELYNIAQNKSINIINSIQKYFNDKINLNEVLNIIENNSYYTGLELGNRSKMIHFEY